MLYSVALTATFLGNFFIGGYFMNHPYVNIAVLLSPAPSATVPPLTPPSPPLRNFFTSSCGLAENVSPIFRNLKWARADTISAAKGHAVPPRHAFPHPTHTSSPYCHYFASTCGLAETVSPFFGNSKWVGADIIAATNGQQLYAATNSKVAGMENRAPSGTMNAFGPSFSANETTNNYSSYMIGSFIAGFALYLGVSLIDAFVLSKFQGLQKGKKSHGCKAFGRVLYGRNSSRRAYLQALRFRAWKQTIIFCLIWKRPNLVRLAKASANPSVYAASVKKMNISETWAAATPNDSVARQLPQVAAAFGLYSLIDICEGLKSEEVTLILAAVVLGCTIFLWKGDLRAFLAGPEKITVSASATTATTAPTAPTAPYTLKEQFVTASPETDLPRFKVCHQEPVPVSNLKNRNQLVKNDSMGYQEIAIDEIENGAICDWKVKYDELKAKYDFLSEEKAGMTSQHQMHSKSPEFQKDSGTHSKEMSVQVQYRRLRTVINMKKHDQLLRNIQFLKTQLIKESQQNAVLLQNHKVLAVAASKLERENMFLKKKEDQFFAKPNVSNQSCQTMADVEVEDGRYLMCEDCMTAFCDQFRLISLNQYDDEVKTISPVATPSASCISSPSRVHTLECWSQESATEVISEGNDFTSFDYVDDHTLKTDPNNQIVKASESSYAKSRKNMGTNHEDSADSNSTSSTMIHSTYPAATLDVELLLNFLEVSNSANSKYLGDNLPAVTPAVTPVVAFDDEGYLGTATNAEMEVCDQEAPEHIASASCNMGTPADTMTIVDGTNHGMIDFLLLGQSSTSDPHREEIDNDSSPSVITVACAVGNSCENAHTRHVFGDEKPTTAPDLDSMGAFDMLFLSQSSTTFPSTLDYIEIDNDDVVQNAGMPSLNEENDDGGFLSHSENTVLADFTKPSSIAAIQYANINIVVTPGQGNPNSVPFGNNFLGILVENGACLVSLLYYSLNDNNFSIGDYKARALNWILAFRGDFQDDIWALTHLTVEQYVELMKDESQFGDSIMLIALSLSLQISISITLFTLDQSFIDICSFSPSNVKVFGDARIFLQVSQYHFLQNELSPTAPVIRDVVNESLSDRDASPAALIAPVAWAPPAAEFCLGSEQPTDFMDIGPISEATWIAAQACLEKFLNIPVSNPEATQPERIVLNAGLRKPSTPSLLSSSEDENSDSTQDSQSSDFDAYQIDNEDESTQSSDFDVNLADSEDERSEDSESCYFDESQKNRKDFLSKNLSIQAVNVVLPHPPSRSQSSGFALPMKAASIQDEPVIPSSSAKAAQPGSESKVQVNMNGRLIAPCRGNQLPVNPATTPAQNPVKFVIRFQNPLYSGSKSVVPIASVVQNGLGLDGDIDDSTKIKVIHAERVSGDNIDSLPDRTVVELESTVGRNNSSSSRRTPLTKEDESFIFDDDSDIPVTQQERCITPMLHNVLDMVADRKIAKCFSRQRKRTGYPQAPLNASFEAKIEASDDSKVDQDSTQPGSPTSQWILDSICKNINENQEDPEDSDDPQEYQDSVPPGSPMPQWLLDAICDSLNVDRESFSGDCHDNLSCRTDEKESSGNEERRLYNGGDNPWSKGKTSKEDEFFLCDGSAIFSPEQQIPVHNESDPDEHELSNMTQEEEDSLIFGAISANPRAVCRGSHGRRVPKNREEKERHLKKGDPSL